MYAVLVAGDAGDVWVARPRCPWSGFTGDAPIVIIRFPAKPYLRTVTPLARFGGFALMPSIAIRRETTPRLRCRPRFRSLTQRCRIAATEDGSGALWLAAQREGLFYRKKGVWQRLETASEFARLSPRTAFTDWMGRAWFGYEGGTIILLKDENIQRVFPADDSPVGSVRAINGRGRHTWVGGELGLAFFDGNRFRRIVPADAETFGSVMGVEEAPDGSLWLAESRGVIQVPASEVQQALDNPSYRVKYRIFDSFDGLSGTFAGAANNRKEIQGTDGRLWFVASGGVVWVDPANISTNTLPPPVLIRSVSSEWQTTWFAGKSRPAPANNQPPNWLHGFEPGCAGESTFSVQAGRSG